MKLLYSLVHGNEHIPSISRSKYDNGILPKSPYQTHPNEALWI